MALRKKKHQRRPIAWPQRLHAPEIRPNRALLSQQVRRNERRLPLSSTTVSLPGPLRAKVGNRTSIPVEGKTIREIIRALDHEFPGLQFHLCYETGELRPYVNIYLDKENIRYLQGLETPVPTGSTLRILQAVAGG